MSQQDKTPEEIVTLEDALLALREALEPIFVMLLKIAIATLRAVTRLIASLIELVDHAETQEAERRGITVEELRKELDDDNFS